MAKSVGPVNIKVGMNAAGAFAEIGKLENRLKKSQTTVSKFSKGAGAFGGGFAKTIGGGLPGAGMITGLLAGGPIGAGIMAATALIEGVTDALDRMRIIGKLAQRLDISIESMVGLDLAASRAGVDTDLLTTSMFKLRQNLGEAAQGSAAQVATLSRLGLTYQQIQSMPLDRQFATIADRLNLVSDSNERAALTVELFGRSGQQLGLLLQRGSKGLEAARAEAERLGLMFSSADLARVKALNLAWKKAGSAMQGMTNRLVVALAPALESVGLGLAAFVEGLTMLTNAVAGGLTELNRQARSWALFINERTGGTLSRPVSGILEQSIAQMQAAIDQMPPIEQQIVQIVTRLDTHIVSGFTNLTNSIEAELAIARGGSPLGNQLAGLQEKLDAQIAGIRDTVTQQVTQMAAVAAGFGPAAVQALQPVFDAMAAQAQKQIQSLQLQFNIQADITKKKNEELRLLKARNALEQQAAQIAQQFQTPLETFTQRLGELNQLQARGLLSGNVGALATGAAFRTLQDLIPQANATGPEALQMGSVAAQVAINRFNRQGGAVSLQEQIRNILRQQTQIEQQQLGEAREIRRILAGLGVVAPAGLAP